MTSHVKAWRITSRRYTESAFDGEGARRYGGRWNSPGVPMLYLAESLSLAALEQLVHLSRGDLLERQFARFRVRFPPHAVLELDEQALPDEWTEDVSITRRLGDDWIKASDSLALKVPSAVVPEEHNYIVNPGHADVDRIDIGPAEPFTFDKRLTR